MSLTGLGQPLTQPKKVMYGTRIRRVSAHKVHGTHFLHTRRYIRSRRWLGQSRRCFKRNIYVAIIVQHGLDMKALSLYLLFALYRYLMLACDARSIGKFNVSARRQERKRVTVHKDCLGWHWRYRLVCIIGPWRNTSLELGRYHTCSVGREPREHFVHDHAGTRGTRSENA